LIREVLAQSMKTSQTETDLKKLEFKSTSLDEASNESSICSSFRSKKFLNGKFVKCESFTRVNDDSKIKKKRKKDLLSRSCISQ
jgi:flagellin-like hook-associated protein FlgL